MILPIFAVIDGVMVKKWRSVVSVALQQDKKAWLKNGKKQGQRPCLTQGI